MGDRVILLLPRIFSSKNKIIWSTGTCTTEANYKFMREIMEHTILYSVIQNIFEVYVKTHTIIIQVKYSTCTCPCIKIEHEWTSIQLLNYQKSVFSAGKTNLIDLRTQSTQSFLHFTLLSHTVKNNTILLACPGKKLWRSWNIFLILGILINIQHNNFSHIKIASPGMQLMDKPSSYNSECKRLKYISTKINWYKTMHPYGDTKKLEHISFFIYLTLFVADSSYFSWVVLERRDLLLSVQYDNICLEWICLQ
jgi:hypothetical protein